MSPSSAGMGPHNRAVHNPMFHVRLVGKVSEHAFPDALLTPPSEAFVDAIPVAILFGQEAPLRSRAVNPEHGFQEATAGCLVANVNMWVASKKGVQFGPDCVIQIYSCHAATVPSFHQMSTEPSFP